MKYKHDKTKGFTVIELMIAVAIAGVLAAVAIPSFSDMIKKNRMSSQANTIMTSLNFARNETINRGVDILVSPITTGANNWADGWSVSAGGTVIRNFEALDGSKLEGTPVASATTITYESTGRISGTVSIVLTLTAKECDTGKEYVRTITISPSGHARVNRSNCS